MLLALVLSSSGLLVSNRTKGLLHGSGSKDPASGRAIPE